MKLSLSHPPTSPFLTFLAQGWAKFLVTPAGRLHWVPSRLALKFPPVVMPVCQVAPSVSPWPGLCLCWCLLGSGIWGDRACLAFITQKWSLGSDVLLWYGQCSLLGTFLGYLWHISSSYTSCLGWKYLHFIHVNSINQIVFTDHTFLLLLFVIWGRMVAFCKTSP